jgi:hypothetical protein
MSFSFRKSPHDFLCSILCNRTGVAIVRQAFLPVEHLKSTVASKFDFVSFSPDKIEPLSHAKTFEK